MTKPKPGNEGGAGATMADEGPVKVLLRVATNARLFRSTDGRLLARVPVQSRREVYAFKSRAFRDWLVGGYFRECEELPTDTAVRRVLGALEAFARFDAGTPPVFIRVGRKRNSHDSPYYFDLGDSSGQAVEIGPEGWSIVEKPGVHFRRPEGLLPLPSPSRRGSIELLRPYVNLTQRDFRLLVVWMAAALRPVGPYPILALYGEQGSAKSTLARVVRRLIDPQAAPLLVEPRSTRDLKDTAVNGWLLAYDKIGVIPASLSHGLCMLSTGGAFARRTLFANQDWTVVYAQRPVILNGIEKFVKRRALRDRSLFLNLPRISSRNRRREDEFWAAFNHDEPRILGGLLDAVTGGIRELPSIKLTELPRMADFAAFAEAVGRSLGWQPETVLADYKRNRQEAIAVQLEDSLVATAILETTPNQSNWVGTASELLEQLNAIVGSKMAASASWPKSAGWFNKELRRITPQLRKHGIFIRYKQAPGKRLLIVKDKRRQTTHMDSSELDGCGEGLMAEEDNVKTWIRCHPECATMTLFWARRKKTSRETPMPVRPSRHAAIWGALIESHAATSLRGSVPCRH